MAKGSLAKEKIFEKMLEVFEGSFMYNNGKELRIPFDEEGKLVEIKVALTCAKDLVGSGNEVMKPAAAPSELGAFMNEPEVVTLAEPSQEEKQNVEDLLKSLGLN